MDNWCISKAVTNDYFCSLFIILEKNSQKCVHMMLEDVITELTLSTCLQEALSD